MQLKNQNIYKILRNNHTRKNVLEKLPHYVGLVEQLFVYLDKLQKEKYLYFIYAVFCSCHLYDSMRM